MSLVTVVLALLLAPAANPPAVEMDAEAEVEMALSGAPEHLKAQAGVYRLAADGYVQVRPSANGFNCLVSREPSAGLGPICYDSEGSDTTLKADLLRGKLLRQGLAEDDIEKRIDAEYRAGRLLAPRRAGIVYMLSEHFSQLNKQTGRRECIFPPHLMFYAPNLKNSDIGAAANHRGSTELPWIINEGKPNAYILVVSHAAHVEMCK